MKKPKLLTIKDPILLCGAWYWLLARDATGLVRMSLLAAVWHECGHIAAWVLLTRRPPHLEAGLTGLCLHWQESDFSPREVLLLALAGPAANLLLAGAVLLLMQLRAGAAGYSFACCNLLLAGFNLLPVPPLDGNYVRLFLARKLHSRSK